MIEVLRVDDRLLHGQVAVSWTRHYKVDVILVANNHLITDKDMQVAFRLATPSGVTLSMKSLQGAVNVINNPKHAMRKIMVITKDLNDAKFVCEQTNGAIKDILLGGLRNGEGKKQIDMNSYMSKNDIHVMDELEKEGYHVFMQSVPTSQKLSTEESYYICLKSRKIFLDLT